MSTHQKTFQWLMAWILFLFLLSAFSRTRFGSVVVYYSLVLMVLFVFLSQAPRIAGLLKPIGERVPFNT